VFGDTIKVLSPADINIIMRLPLPRQTSTTRRLFFPIIGDFDMEEKKLPWYVMHGLQSKPTEENIVNWPEMAIQYTVGDVEGVLTKRRPGFLLPLLDKDYCELFEKLLSAEACDMEPPKWDHFMVECQKIGPTVSAILHQVLWWFRPKFKKPATSSKDLASFQWVPQIADDIIRRRVRGYKKPTPPRRQSTTELNATDAKAFVKEIWNLVRVNYGALTNSSIKSWVCL
jgi:hypothetical protein